MKNILNSIRVPKPQKSTFDLSHDFKFSANMGTLVPVMYMDCAPSDKVNLSQQALIRFMPMVAPPMHRYNVYFHSYFVPYRILWHGWDNFVTNTDGGAGVPLHPWISVYRDGSNYSELLNYMGIPKPPGVAGDNLTVSALPFAAYQCIWSEYYRDQNFQTEAVWQLQSGGNDLNSSLRTLRRRCWEHDYFTSALPDTQFGSEVQIPLGDVELKMSAAGTDQLLKSANDFTTAIPSGSNLETGAGGKLSADVVGVDTDAVLDPNGTLQVGATNINDLRRAYALQRWAEKAMRGGRRLTEYIWSMFAEKPQDARLQRPEYIGGSKAPVMISEVLNTTGTEEAPQGNMAGHGIATSAGKNGFYHVREHGCIITLMSIMPRTAYAQGVPKHFSKINDFTEYIVPDFANIGEQEVKGQEIYAWENASYANSTFGYQSRYCEYKYMPSRVAGDLTDSLDFWSSYRKFETAPALNSDFVECVPDDRIFAVTDPEEHKLICHVYHQIIANRPLPYWGTPV